MMDSLEYMVDKVTIFFFSTLPHSKVGGPFSTSSLRDMFSAAHFCARLSTDSLPPSYHQAVDQLQAQFALLSAPHNLLLSLADNVRVNRLAMDTARQFHDEQGEDLASWLCCSQRNQLRDQFLLISQQLKNTGSEWEKLKSYMCLVELVKKEGRGIERMVRDKTDLMLGTLRFKDDQYSTFHQQILELLPGVINLDKLEMLNKEVLAEVVCEKTEILNLVIKVFVESLNTDKVLDTIERVAEVLERLALLCNGLVASELLERVEKGIGNKFVREELTNCMVVRVRSAIRSNK